MTRLRGRRPAAAALRRPRAWRWILAAMVVAAGSGFSVIVWPWDCFLSAAAVGLSQGWLLRRTLGSWWSWTMTTAIAGGAALAIVRLFAEISSTEAAAIVSVQTIATMVARAFCGGAVVGACQAFLLAGRHRGAVWWVGASALGAALSWTLAAIAPGILAGPWNTIAASSFGSSMAELATTDWAVTVSDGRLVNAAALALCWGGVAAATATILAKLQER